MTGTRVSENELYIAERLYTEDDFIVTQKANGMKDYALRPELPQPLGGILVLGY